MFKIPIVNHSLKYNPSLDGIRGIAIISVLLFHIWPNYFKYGYLGVDLFFVLSGFLITKIIYIKLEKKQFNFIEFYRNRIRRIFPAVILVLSFVLIVGYLFLFPLEYKDLGHHVKSSALFYENFRLMREVGYWDKAAELKPLLHFWSLAIEEQFYLIWPIVVILIYKFNNNNFLVIKFVIVFLILIIIAYICPYDKFYHPLSRFWELSFGALLFALSYKFKKEVSSKNIIFSFYPLVFLGLISFPLYLWHYVLISFMHIFEINVQQYGFLIIIISILISYLTYSFVEIYSRKQNSYLFAALLFILLISIGFIGNYIYTNNGLPNRSFLPKINKLYQKQFIREKAKNKNGLILVKNILGYIPNNDYIKSTSNNINKHFVVIIGDSHAHTSYPGFASLFKTVGYETLLIANSSCPPYIGEAMGKNIKDLKECEYKINNIYKTLNRLPHIKKVVFATRGTVYMKGIGYGIVENGGKPLKYYFRDHFYNIDNNRYNSFKKGLKRTFKFFSKKNYDFYFLLEDPELGFDPKNCMIRPFGIFKSKCKITLKSFLNRQEEYRKLVYNMAQKYNINILDPKNLYCDSKYCYAIVDNKMMYADDDHHSIDGSYKQAKFFKEKLLNVKQTKTKK